MFRDGLGTPGSQEGPARVVEFRTMDEVGTWLQDTRVSAGEEIFLETYAALMLAAGMGLDSGILDMERRILEEDMSQWQGKKRGSKGGFLQEIQEKAKVLALHRIAHPETLGTLRELLEYRMSDGWFGDEL